MGDQSAPAYGLEDAGTCPSAVLDSSSPNQDPARHAKSDCGQPLKGEQSGSEDETEPPPAYSEGPSPLRSFTFVMAAAGGVSSIITQVQQGGPPISALGGKATQSILSHVAEIDLVTDALPFSGC